MNSNFLTCQFNELAEYENISHSFKLSHCYDECLDEGTSLVTK